MSRQAPGEVQLQARLGERAGQAESGLEMLGRRSGGPRGQGLAPGRGQDGNSFGVALQMGAEGVGGRFGGRRPLLQQRHERAGMKALAGGRRQIVVQCLAEQGVHELCRPSREAPHEPGRAQRLRRLRASGADWPDSRRTASGRKRLPSTLAARAQRRPGAPTPAKRGRKTRSPRVLASPLSKSSPRGRASATSLSKRGLPAQA